MKWFQDKRESPARPLVFLHVPKTGGTSTGDFLSRLVPPDRMSTAFDDLTLTDCRERHSGGMDLYAGHFTWAAIQSLFVRPRILTMLRDPIQRCVSQYRNFADKSRIQPRWENSPEGREVNALLLGSTMTMTEMMAHTSLALRGAFSNVMTRSFLPFDLTERELAPNFFSGTYVALAVHNLLFNTTWFGLLERSEDSLLLLCRALGLPSLGALESFNVSENADSASLDDIELCRSLNRMDTRFFEMASAEFARRAEQISATEVNAHYVRHSRARTERDDEGVSQGATPIEDLPVTANAHGLELSASGRTFRWFRSSEAPAFFVVLSKFPDDVYVHTLQDPSDLRLPLIALVIAGVTYTCRSVFAERGGSLLVLTRAQGGSTTPALADACVLGAWFVGPDEIATNQYGQALPYLAAVTAIEFC